MTMNFSRPFPSNQIAISRFVLHNFGSTVRNPQFRIFPKTPFVEKDSEVKVFINS